MLNEFLIFPDSEVALYVQQQITTETLLEFNRTVQLTLNSTQFTHVHAMIHHQQPKKKTAIKLLDFKTVKYPF